jgi:cytochrome c oxidase cbb3-type subunit III
MNSHNIDHTQNDPNTTPLSVQARWPAQRVYTPELKQPQLLDHEYDGICEYDNPTPGWWHALFILSVVFSVLYIAWYSLSPIAPTIQQAWKAQQVAEYKAIFGKIGTLEADEPTILKMMDDPQMMAVASGLFASNCAACHGKDGGGINGVNLTDNHYKNVGSLADIYNIVNTGAANGAMPAWENRLSKNERVLLSAYVANLRGTTPSAPRAPEGSVIPDWPRGTKSSAARN